MHYENMNTDASPAPIVPVTAQLHAIVKPNTPTEYIAYGISQVGSPPIEGLFALTMLTTTLTLSSAWPWLSIFVIFGMLLPISFLVWQLRRGHITDLDVQVREQRKAVMLVTIAGCAITWILMVIGNAPSVLKLMVGATTLQWLTIFAITMRWKVSVHSTSATGMTMIILHVFGLSAAPIVFSIPLIAWSRVKLKHHTPAQTLVGILLGIVVFGLAILIS